MAAVFEAGEQVVRAGSIQRRVDVGCRRRHARRDTPRTSKRVQALDRLLTDVVSGTSRVTILRGDTGVGKSELLSYLSDRVAG
jgi:predicted ATP-dependent serine protease